MDNTLFREFSRSGGGFIINRLMVRTIGAELAIFIADLSNRDYMANEPDGWFFSTKKERSHDLGMGDRTLVRLMNESLELGIVQTVIKGQPAKQYIKIDYDRIQRLCSERLAADTGASSQCGTGASSQCDTGASSQCDTGAALYIEKEESKEEESKDIVSDKKDVVLPTIKSTRTLPNIPEPIPEPKQLTKQDKINECLPLAELLKSIVLQVKRINTPPDHIRSWAKEILKLKEERCVNLGKIERALKWYADYLPKHYGEDFCLTIMSGSSLREKFVSLTNAMDRGTKQPTNGKGPNNFKLADTGKYAKYSFEALQEKENG